MQLALLVHLQILAAALLLILLLLSNYRITVNCVPSGTCYECGTLRRLRMLLFFILRITPESFQNRFSKVSAYAIERKNSVVLQELRQ